MGCEDVNLAELARARILWFAVRMTVMVFWSSNNSQVHNPQKYYLPLNENYSSLTYFKFLTAILIHN
jgi:hypothetical protein